MAASNNFQPSIVLGFKTLGVTEREVEIRLRLILWKTCYAAVVSAPTDFMAVPRPTGIARWPRQELVVIEIDRVAAEAHSLQLEHLWVCEDPH